MNKTIELLAPGGDIDSIKAAIASGANAVYCGLNKFNARNRAANISFEDLNGLLRLAHKHHCQVFITLNIIIVDSEIPDLIRVLNKLINTSIDGVIIQDLGLFYLLSKYFGSLKIHASTQLTTHNVGQIKFLNELNATRVNLSRELNINEIKSLTSAAHQVNVLTEVFIHGSYCISFSGLCYMSSLHGGNSANRGRCSQPCRDQYQITAQDNQFPLNLKDNSALTNIKELADAGADSLKIEGRIKKYHYVYLVVEAYQKQLQRMYNGEELSKQDNVLFKVFNRDFSNCFLSGDISKQMFIENPRDNSPKHWAALKGDTSNTAVKHAEQILYAERGSLREQIKSKIDQLDANQAPLKLFVSGKEGCPLKLEVQTPDSSFVLLSETNLIANAGKLLDSKELLKRFKVIDETEFILEELNMDKLPSHLFIHFKELTALKNRLLFILRDSKKMIAPVALPVLKMDKDEGIKPTISVLISSQNDINVCREGSVDIYYQLPNAIKHRATELIELFSLNKDLTPWFPAVIIGDDYSAAIMLLKGIQPNLIVTNNTGIAYEANQMGISWIAGPQLNVVNSYSLICLKESFNCSGAFVSNEISRQQIRNIKKPDHFRLYYSIYHPVVLMTSRQCLFHQVIGCDKESMDEDCMGKCNKTTSITNIKKNTFIIDKIKGEYNHIYNDTYFLNTDIIKDIPDTFSSYFIDLREIKTQTKVAKGKAELIQLFKNSLNGDSEHARQLKQVIQPATMQQYKKGI